MQQKCLMGTMKMLSIVSIVALIVLCCFMLSGYFYYYASPMWALLVWHNLSVLPVLYHLAVSNVGTVLTITPLLPLGGVPVLIVTLMAQLVTPCLTLYSLHKSKPLFMLPDIILTALGLVNMFIALVVSAFIAFKYLDFRTSRVHVIVDLKVFLYLVILIGFIVFMVCVFIGKWRCFISLRGKKNNTNIYYMFSMCGVISIMISVFAFRFIVHS
jgi:hypothetical protein